jgi:mono/diheme cytochrome c family protein
MNRTPAFLMSLRFLALSGSIAWAFLNAAQAGVSFAKGDLVRTQRGEMLQFKGEDLVPAGKGQEFTVLAHESVRGVVYVGYTKEDGTLIAASLPAEIVTPAPRDGWQDLFQGMEAFREQRYEEAKKLLGKASQDSQHRVLASGLALRVNALLTAAGQALSADPDRKSAGARIFLNALQGMRELSGQLSQAKHYSLALALEEGGERLAAQALGAGAVAGLPATKVDRQDLQQRASTAARALARCRQAVPLKRLLEASKEIGAGLAADPMRPEFKPFEAQIQRGIEDAEDAYKSANAFRRHHGGTVHALSALEDGLKRCADHPQLAALKKEMQGAFEERTAPPLTPPLLAAVKYSGSIPQLEEGRKLYTVRCTQCHDLELLDSRSMSGWEKAVTGMAGRARLDDKQKTRILDYIAVAQSSLAPAK